MEKKNISWSQQDSDACSKCDVKANYSVIFNNLSNTYIECIPHFTSGIPSGTIIYEQGSKDDYIYTIKSGIVAIIDTDDNLKERTVELLTKGMIAGIEPTYNQEYLQTAISLTPVSLCKIKLTKDYIDTHKNYDLCHNISKKWQEKYNNQIRTTEFTIGQTKERLIKLFTFLSKHTYMEDDNEFYMLPLRHISSIIGISVENTSRTLSKMKKNSILKINAKKFKYIN